MVQDGTVLMERTQKKKVPVPAGLSRNFDIDKGSTDIDLSKETNSDAGDHKEEAAFSVSFSS